MVASGLMTRVTHPSKEKYFIALLKIAYTWDNNSSWFYYFKILSTCPQVDSSHGLPVSTTAVESAHLCLNLTPVLYINFYLEQDI